MSEQNEIITTHGHQIEKSIAGNVPLEAQLPKKGERLVVGALPQTETQEGKTGIEVVSLSEYPRDANGNILYRNSVLSGKLEAILIDPTTAPDFTTGQGFKGLRKGEVVSGDVLTTRFGKEAGFSLGINDEGKIMIENGDPSQPLEVLAIRPIAEEADDPALTSESISKMMGVEEEVVSASPAESPIESVEAIEASAELHEEAAEDMAEKAVAESVEIEEETPTVEKSEAAPSLGQILGEAKLQYNRTTEMLIEDASGDLRASLGRIETELQEFDGNLRSFNFIRDETQALQHIIMNMNGSYTNDMAKTMLKRTTDSLHGIYRRLNIATERGVIDLVQPALTLDTALDTAKLSLEANDRGFVDFVEEQKQRMADQEAATPETSTDEFLGKIVKAKEMVGALVAAPNSVQGQLEDRVLKLRTQMTMLENIADDRAAVLEPGVLQSAIVALNEIVDGSDSLKLTGKIEDNLDQLRGLFR